MQTLNVDKFVRLELTLTLTHSETCELYALIAQLMSKCTEAGGSVRQELKR